jgi:hypothetical protein
VWQFSICGFALAGRLGEAASGIERSHFSNDAKVMAPEAEGRKNAV